MLNDKLQLFYQLANQAVALHGMNAAAVADTIIEQAFPDTSASAAAEGADTMLRNGVIKHLTDYFKRAPANDDRQLSFDIPEQFEPIVSKLKGEAHYVEKLARYISVPMLISNPDWLDDARKYKRKKGQETLAEAAILDELYEAIMAEVGAMPVEAA